MKVWIDTAVLCLCVLAAGSFGYWVYFDLGGGIPALTLLIYAAVCSAVMLSLVVWRYKRAKLLIYGVFLLSLVILAAFPWTPRDHFLRRLYSVRPGMTIAQADTIMRPYARWRGAGPDRFARSRGVDLVIGYGHSESAEYNADVGLINCRHGRVVGVEFFAD